MCCTLIFCKEIFDFPESRRRDERISASLSSLTDTVLFSRFAFILKRTKGCSAEREEKDRETTTHTVR